MGGMFHSGMHTGLERVCFEVGVGVSCRVRTIEV